MHSKYQANFNLFLHHIFRLDQSLMFRHSNLMIKVGKFLQMWDCKENTVIYFYLQVMIRCLSVYHE